MRFDIFTKTFNMKCETAAGKLIKGSNELLVFYNFQAEHWKHIRTTNPLESAFARVWKRVPKTKGWLHRKTALVMDARSMMSAKKTWQKLSAPKSSARGRSWG